MKKIDLIYPELYYEIVGILYDVFNEVGGIIANFNREGVRFKRVVNIK